MFFSKISAHLVIIIALIIVLTACAGTSMPVAEQTSLPAPHTPLQKTPTITPMNTVTPIVTTVPPTRTPTPTPKPSLEDVLLANARHIQGVDDAPVTLIEFSDFK